jgi:hypothetical protein
MANKNGLILLTPSSVDKTGTGSTATINTNGSVTFGSCETLSLNGIFTTDYDNYMIVMRNYADAAASTNMYGRLRASGTDNTTASSYVSQRLRADSTTISGARTTADSWQPFFRVGDSTATTLRGGAIIYLFGPKLAQPTAMRTVIVDTTSGAYFQDAAGTHNQSTAYDGLTCLASAASRSITGLVCVYGMRN